MTNEHSVLFAVVFILGAVLIFVGMFRKIGRNIHIKCNGDILIAIGVLMAALSAMGLLIPLLNEWISEIEIFLI